MNQRALTAPQDAAQLGYPADQTRRASSRAAAVLRGRQARPYLAAVAQALHARGWSSTDTPPAVQHRRWGFWGSSFSISKVTLPPQAGTVPDAVCLGLSWARPKAISRTMARPSFAAGDVVGVAAHLHLPVVEVRRSRLVLLVLEGLA
ncbi:hypothetical protein [Streptomyces sp. NPDC005930]|uniref:hypothetical protein n=1 Tax=Streptomyces sp. NPDC005930 TaxID=3364736 RepID=UPI003682E778